MYGEYARYIQASRSRKSRAPAGSVRDAGFGRRLALICLALASLLVLSTSNASAAALEVANAVNGGSTPTDRFADRALTPKSTAGDSPGASSPAGPSAARVVFSLAGVIALIILLGWICRRMFARQQGSAGAVALVSRTLLTPRHQVLIVRVGQRLLVVGDSGHGMNLLCDVTDPEEIESILGDAFELGQQAEQTISRKDSRLLPPADADGHEEPPVNAVPDEVRALIERVRGLASQAKHNAAQTSDLTAQAR